MRNKQNDFRAPQDSLVKYKLTLTFNRHSPRRRRRADFLGSLRKPRRQRRRELNPLPRVVPWFPLLGLTPSGLFMGSVSTYIYTSELILCFIICVHSATRHNIHMYPYFLFAAIHHLKSSPTFSVRPRSSVSRVTVDLIRRSWVRFPPRSNDFFFTSCGSLIPFTRANAQWVIHGSVSTYIYTSELILCFTICVHSATRHNIHMYRIKCSL